MSGGRHWLCAGSTDQRRPADQQWPTDQPQTKRLRATLLRPLAHGACVVQFHSPKRPAACRYAAGHSGCRLACARRCRRRRRRRHCRHLPRSFVNVVACTVPPNHHWLCCTAFHPSSSRPFRHVKSRRSAPLRSAPLPSPPATSPLFESCFSACHFLTNHPP